MARPTRASPFFGLNDKMPVVLALILGFQHALAMLAGIITPPIIMAGAGGLNLVEDQQQYLVSTALIVSGLLSMIQITRFHIYKTPYETSSPLLQSVCVLRRAMMGGVEISSPSPSIYLCTPSYNG